MTEEERRSSDTPQSKSADPKSDFIGDWGEFWFLAVIILFFWSAFRFAGGWHLGWRRIAKNLVWFASAYAAYHYDITPWLTWVVRVALVALALFALWVSIKLAKSWRQEWSSALCVLAVAAIVCAVLYYDAAPWLASVLLPIGTCWFGAVLACDVYVICIRGTVMMLKMLLGKHYPVRWLATTRALIGLSLATIGIGAWLAMQMEPKDFIEFIGI
jgi:hypothetical protein